MALWQWSTTAANNATADPSINWQEGQAPSTVNDSARAMMAAVAEWFPTAEWQFLGDIPTYVSATQFTVPTNRTSVYTVGRRVRTFNTGGTLYGTITASAFTSLTTVTVTLDSGSLDSGLSEVDVGIMNPSSRSLPTGVSPSLLNIQVFTSAGTYTPTLGATKAIIEAVGGGGAGGGAPATGAGQLTAGAGGGSGAYVRAAILSNLSSYAGTVVTPGGSGAGVVGAAGGSGGTTTFGTSISCPGGNSGFAGAIFGAVSAYAIIAAGPGTATSSPTCTLTTLNSDSGSTGDAAFLAGTSGAASFSGRGADSGLGRGGASISSTGSGVRGGGYGAGGSGAFGAVSAAAAGGNGSPGVVMIFEFA